MAIVNRKETFMHTKGDGLEGVKEETCKVIAKKLQECDAFLVITTKGDEGETKAMFRSKHILIFIQVFQNWVMSSILQTLRVNRTEEGKDGSGGHEQDANRHDTIL